MDFEIRAAELRLGSQCEAVLRDLPEWFGIESALRAYVNKVDYLPTYTAVIEERIIGFLSVERHYSESAEIHVMGILPEFHRMGIGRALQREAELDLVAQGVKFLQVKTLSPSSPNKDYAETRKFYLSTGFSPLEEMSDLWGAENPCLIMVKSLEESGEHF
ncbi:MAG: GNAT family N-acetyltransferase [Candidatus Sabulitectum sp.]|nr:GNAT family N-acetyltransferase [Candidatus Sabulitectum sp.]